jgi:hypothetical protein
MPAAQPRGAPAWLFITWYVVVVAIAGNGVVIWPLVRVTEVSNWVHGSVEPIVVIATVHRVVGRVVIWGAIVIGTAIGGIWALVGTWYIYPRIVAACCDTNAHARAYPNSDTTVAVADADGAIGDDAGRISAVLLLADIAEKAALAVARRVDVLVTRLWVRLHYGDEWLKEVLDFDWGV